MITFKSIIVLDTETTSLPNLDHNTTKITELAVLGCEIDHLLQSKELPRVLHKLVLLFNPMKTIHPTSSHNSGLCNEMLMNIQPFSKQDAETLAHFINRLPTPVCMIAHNGYKFDFPILRKALESVNKNLPNNIYCADSLKAFRELLPIQLSGNIVKEQPTHHHRDGYKTPKNQETKLVNSLHYKNVSRELFPDDFILEQVDFEEICSQAEKFRKEETSPQTPPQKPPDNTQQDNNTAIDLFPDDFMLERAISQESHILDNQNETKILFSQPKSFKLSDVYRFLFDKQFQNAHRAENDSKALLECIKGCRGFFDWLKKNSVVFNSIQPLF